MPKTAFCRFSTIFSLNSPENLLTILMNKDNVRKISRLCNISIRQYLRAEYNFSFNFRRKITSEILLTNTDD